MQPFHVLFGICLFLVNICLGFTIEINLKNPSEIPLICSVSLVRSYTDEYGNYWPFFGYLSKKGLLKKKPDAADLIGSGDESGWVKLPAHGRIVICERISKKSAKWIVDVRVSEKETTARSFSIPEALSVFYIYLYTVPVSPGPIKFEILSADEVVDRNLEVISQTAKEKLFLRILLYTLIVI